MLHSAEHRQSLFRVGRIGTTTNEGIVKTRGRGATNFSHLNAYDFL